MSNQENNSKNMSLDLISVVAPIEHQEEKMGQSENNCEKKHTEQKTTRVSWCNRIALYFKEKTAGLTKRQLSIFFVFIFVEFFAATVVSIQAPFYPHVAETKGLNPTQYGMVFGIFELTKFILSPVFGYLISKADPKLLFNMGIFTTSSCCILFGTLNLLQTWETFFGLSLLLRFVEAAGESAFVTSSFAIIAMEFPDSVATTFASMETFYGLGLILGPTIGGLLYEVGGFQLPFTFMGSCLFACSVLAYCILPSEKIKDEESCEETSVKPGAFAIFKLLKIPVIAIIAYGIMSTACGIGYLSATLEPFLRHTFSLGPVLISLVFILNGGVYALTAPIWGKICDKFSQSKVITLIGAGFTITGFFLIGPTPFVPIQETLWITCLGLVFFGLGLGATLVSAFTQMLQDAINDGYVDDISTYGLISGLWTSMTALGFFVGPCVGGYLLENVGFRNGSTFVLAGQLILVILVIAVLVLMPNSKSVEMTRQSKQNSRHGKDVESNCTCSSGVDNVVFEMDSNSDKMCNVSL